MHQPDLFESECEAIDTTQDVRRRVLDRVIERETISEILDWQLRDQEPGQNNGTYFHKFKPLG